MAEIDLTEFREKIARALDIPLELIDPPHRVPKGPRSIQRWARSQRGRTILKTRIGYRMRFTNSWNSGLASTDEQRQYLDEHTQVWEQKWIKALALRKVILSRQLIGNGLPLIKKGKRRGR